MRISVRILTHNATMTESIVTYLAQVTKKCITLKDDNHVDNI